MADPHYLMKWLTIYSSDNKLYHHHWTRPHSSHLPLRVIPKRFLNQMNPVTWQSRVSHSRELHSVPPYKSLIAPWAAYWLALQISFNLLLVLATKPTKPNSFQGGIKQLFLCWHSIIILFLLSQIQINKSVFYLRIKSSKAVKQWRTFITISIKFATLTDVVKISCTVPLNLKFICLRMLLAYLISPMRRIVRYYHYAL